VLKAELAVQELSILDGVDGQTVWPLNIDEDQLRQMLDIPSTFTQNTRKKDQIESFTVWAVKSVVLLVTVLSSWQRKQKWCAQIVEIIRKEDPKMKRSWNLRTTFIDETVLPDFNDDTLELTNIVPSVDFVLEQSTVPDKAAHRAALKAGLLAARAHRGLNEIEFDFETDLGDFAILPSEVESRSPFDLSGDEIDLLISNIGTEVPLA
jgi:hypothetical protein